MRTLERKGDRIDIGAQFFHSNYRNTLALLDAVNLGGTKRTVGGKIQFTLGDGSPYLYDYRLPYMKVLGLRGNLKLYSFFLKYVLFGRRFPMYRIEKDIPEYDNAEILSLFDSPADRKLRDFLITTISMGAPEKLSLYHFIHTFRFDAFTSFVALSGGIASLPESLAAQLPVRYEAPVRQLVVEKNRVVGVQMESDGSVKKADHIIVAVDPPSAARLMPDELAAQRAFFEKVYYLPFPMPIFFLDRPLRKDVWSYFTYAGDKRSYMFANDQYAKIPEMIPSGKSVVNAWMGRPETSDLIDAPDDEVIKTAQEDIESMIPGFSEMIEEAMVFRHPYEVAGYPPGEYRRIIDFLEEAKKLGGVSFVSDLFGGSYIEGATAGAARAVERICQSESAA
jgi:predicted NAD/FAD-dependent oxidoreductase